MVKQNVLNVSTAKNLNKHFQRKANTLHTHESILIHTGPLDYSHLNKEQTSLCLLDIKLTQMQGSEFTYVSTRH